MEAFSFVVTMLEGAINFAFNNPLGNKIARWKTFLQRNIKACWH